MKSKTLRKNEAKNKKGGLIALRKPIFREKIDHSGYEVSYDGGKTWSSLS